MLCHAGQSVFGTYLSFYCKAILNSVKKWAQLTTLINIQLYDTS